MRKYVTIQGDTWDIIALQQMGSELQMTALMRANTGQINTVIFESGVELSIPDPEPEVAADLPPWRDEA